MGEKWQGDWAVRENADARGCIWFAYGPFFVAVAAVPVLNVGALLSSDVAINLFWSCSTVGHDR